MLQYGMDRIQLSDDVIGRLWQNWVDDEHDRTDGMIEYYNHKGWDLCFHDSSWSISDSQATFFLLSL